MTNVIIIIGITLFCYSLIVGRKIFLSSVTTNIRYDRSIFLSWFFLFMAKATFSMHLSQDILHSYRYGSPYLQLFWILLAILSLAIAFAKKNFKYGFSRKEILMLFLYAFFGLLSAILSPKPYLSAYKVSLIFIDCALLAVTVGWQVANKKRFPIFDFLIVLISLSLAGSLFGAWLMPGTAFQPNPGSLGVILFGLFPVLHANELGMLGGIVFLVSFVSFMMSESKGEKLCHMSLAGMAAVVIFLAQSRTAIVATAICIPLIIILSGRRLLLRCFMVVLISFFLFSMAGLFVELCGGDVVAPISQYMERGQRDGGFETLNGRAALWMGLGVQLFEEAPLLGAGFDVGVRFYEGNRLGHLHNSFFQVLANSGLLGLIPWLLFVLFIYFKLLKGVIASVRSNDGNDEKYIMMKVFFGSIPLLARIMTGSVMVTHSGSLILFLSIYIVVQYYSDMKSDKVSV